VFYEESCQLLRRVSSFIELNGRKGESEHRVFHARHTHALLTAVIHVFRGRHAACTALSTNPTSSTAIQFHPRLQVKSKSVSCVRRTGHATLSTGFPTSLCSAARTRSQTVINFTTIYEHSTGLHRRAPVCSTAVRTLTVGCLQCVVLPYALSLLTRQSRAVWGFRHRCVRRPGHALSTA